MSESKWISRRDLIKAVDAALAAGLHKPFLEKLWARFPNEPMVKLPCVIESPYQKLFKIINDPWVHGGYQGSGEFGFRMARFNNHFMEFLEDADDMVLAVALGLDVEHPWTEPFKRYKWISFEGCDDRVHRQISCKVPCGMGLTPQTAMVYCVLTGRVESQVPLSVARVLSKGDTSFDVASQLFESMRGTELVPA